MLVSAYISTQHVAHPPCIGCRPRVMAMTGVVGLSIFRWPEIAQIRMHALTLGHPVLGDSLYGTEGGKTKSDRLLLHARRLSFPHVSVPVTIA